jgi:hypothetical protein
MLTSVTTRKEGYQLYVKDGGILSYRDYQMICREFNDKVKEELLEGKRFNMGYSLGAIQIVKVYTNGSVKKINWKESLQYRKELLEQGIIIKSEENPDGHPWLVYFTEDFIFRIAWLKKESYVKNNTVYNFKATRGAKGFKNQMKDLISDKANHSRFQYFRNKGT